MPTSMDWERVKERLEASRLAASPEHALSPERQEEILRARARDLSREEPAVEDAGGAADALELLLSGERYAVESSFVVEVLPVRELTPLPGTPEFILGIVYVRGRVLCLNDLSRFLGLPQKGLSERDKAVVLRKGQMEIAVLAEAIEGIRTFRPADLQMLPPLQGVERAFLLGVTSDGVSVLDARCILDDPRLVVSQAE